MKVYKSPLPEKSRIAHYPVPDFSDCFRSRLQGTEPVTPDDVMAAFWTTKPAWLKSLFKIRNLMVKPFGLKAGEGDEAKLGEALKNGEAYGFMSVIEKTAAETVVSLDDKHLIAYLSVYIEGRDVFVSTVVRYHNKLGVVYFNLIRPFHTIVVRNIFKRMMRERGF